MRNENEQMLKVEKETTVHCFNKKKQQTIQLNLQLQTFFSIY
jgi:hypothetical protein